MGIGACYKKVLFGHSFMSLGIHMHAFLLGMYHVIELLGHSVCTLCSAVVDTAKQLTKAVVKFFLNEQIF